MCSRVFIPIRLILKIFFIFVCMMCLRVYVLCMCVYTHAHMRACDHGCATVHLWRSKDNSSYPSLSSALFVMEALVTHGYIDETSWSMSF